MSRVLVVDDDAGLRFSLKANLEEASQHEVFEAFDGIRALEILNEKEIDVVILDVDMPRLGGIQTLEKIKEKDPSIVVIMLTAHAHINDAIEAVKKGAYHYLAKPIRGSDLLELIEKAQAAHRLISEVAASAPQINDKGQSIIGMTDQMKKVFHVIQRLSKVDTPVLVRGASGTGKELVARAIHYNSTFKDGHFVAINCSAIPENLFESELFGHEKGSFTGADQRKIGKFQYAEGGTLFLDELGDMPIQMQVKLLRVLQEKVFTPVGSHREIESRVRVIAATNRPLEEMIKKGDFREDLYYRLNVMPIFLPALKERKSDLDHLVQLFVQKFNKEQKRNIIGVDPQAMMVLKKYDWPGNIRELENIIEHAFILEEGKLIQMRSLPEKILSALGIELEKEEIDSVRLEVLPTINEKQSHTVNGHSLGQGLNDQDSEVISLVQLNGDQGLDFNLHKEAFEREFIIKALKMFKGRINQTSLHANIPKKTLLRKIEKYGIVAKDYS